MSGEKGRKGELPGREECLRLLSDNGCDDSVVRHCIAVCDLAVKIARKCRADVDLVEAGALLHDIGRCRSHGIDHAVLGAELADEMGLQKPIVKIVERHIGAGIPRGEARDLGLPSKDYIPETLEEKIVAQADNLIASASRQSVKQAVSQFVREGKYDAARRVLGLHEELSRLCGMNLDDIY